MNQVQRSARFSCLAPFLTVLLVIGIAQVQPLAKLPLWAFVIALILLMISLGAAIFALMTPNAVERSNNRLTAGIGVVLIILAAIYTVGAYL